MRVIAAAEVDTARSHDDATSITLSSLASRRRCETTAHFRTIAVYSICASRVGIAEMSTVHCASAMS